MKDPTQSMLEGLQKLFGEPSVSVVGLGMFGETAPGGMPVPASGIHLRWTVSKNFGFPWYGFYLLRRQHQTEPPKAPQGNHPWNTPLPGLGSVLDLSGTAPLSLAGVTSTDEGEIRRRILALLAGPHRCDTKQWREQLALLVRSWESERGAQEWRHADILTMRIMLAALECQCRCCDCCGDGDGGCAERGSADRPDSGRFDVDVDDDGTFNGGFEQPAETFFGGGWHPVTGPALQQPITLPVYHVAYPASGGAVPNVKAEWDCFSPRIIYGKADDLGQGFPDLHSSLVSLVEGGPGSAMRDVMTETSPGTNVGPDTAEAPSLEGAPVLDFITFATLNPAFAQLLGVYVVDRNVVAGMAYDYLVVADKSHQFGSIDAVVTWANWGAPPMQGVAKCALLNVAAKTAEPLVPPSHAVAYALPGGAAAIGNTSNLVQQVAGRVGLSWYSAPLTVQSAPKAETEILKLHYVWRSEQANGSQPAEGVAAPPASSYVALPAGSPEPVLAYLQPTPLQYKPPADWPQEQLLWMQQIDSEGWYSYRVSAIDLFGRCSRLSPPAQWMTWSPAPVEPPWYFGSELQSKVVHDWAVRILDKTPPPVPPGLEVELIDPLDDSSLNPAAWAKYVASIEELKIQSKTSGADVAALADEIKFGERVMASSFLTSATKHEWIGATKGGAALRVRWNWRWEQIRQAPDAAEFRLYFRNDRFGTFEGNVAAVSADAGDPSGTTYWVQSDLTELTVKAAAFDEAVLRIDQRPFAVLGVKIRQGALSFAISFDGTAATPAPCAGQRFVISATGPAAATAAGLPDPSKCASWASRLAVVPIGDSAHCVVAFETAVDDDGVPLSGDGIKLNGAGFSVGFDGFAGNTGNFLVAVRAGESMLHLGDGPVAAGNCFVITSVDPVAQSVTVDAAVTVKDLGVAWRIGQVVQRYEVFVPIQEYLPEPGVLAPVSWAQVGVSAADGRTHSHDGFAGSGKLLKRLGNEGLVAGPVSFCRVRRTEPEAGAGLVQRPMPVKASKADAHGNSFYTVRWKPVPGLKVHVYRAVDEALFAQDWKNRVKAGSSVAADTKVGIAKLESGGKEAQEHFDAIQAQAAVAAAAKGKPADDARKAAFELYRKLTDWELWVLANLPLMEEAFVQRTVVPLDSAVWADQVGPDDDVEYVVQAGTCAWTDTLPGLAENRYGYRLRFLDGAGNAGVMGVAGVPVGVPRARKLASPRIVRVESADGSATANSDKNVTIFWTLIEPADIVKVYRRFGFHDAAALQEYECIAAGIQMSGKAPGQILTFEDSIAAGCQATYRLVAVTGGRASESSGCAHAWPEN